MTAEQTKKFKKIYNIVSTVVLTVVFLFLIVVIVATVMQKKQGGDIKVFGHYMYTVMSGSMEPTLKTGETIWSKAPVEEDIAVGAIVTFTASTNGINYNETHRISRIEYDENNEKIIYTKGDASENEDRWELESSEIKAVYVKTLPFLSAITSFMREHNFLSYILFVALPLLLVGVLFIVGYVKDKVKSETEETATLPQTEGQPENKVALDDLSEEEKQRILNEFLLSQKEKAQTDEPFESFDDKTENSDSPQADEAENFDSQKNDET